VRLASFLLGLFGGVVEVAGAIIGLGVAGVGSLFVSWGVLSASMGVGFAMVLGVATIFGSVGVMLVHDPRPLGILICVAALGAAGAGGPYATLGALMAGASAWLAFRLDPQATDI
jgi:hypothetical protein